MVCDQEAKDLNTRIAVLEAENVGKRWISPIRVDFPIHQEHHPLTLSPESSLDLNREGSELVDIMLDNSDAGTASSQSH
jgi:hypothetical protein